ncbi:NANOG neighbor homeobox [Plecturocebus cupreus]
MVWARWLMPVIPALWEAMVGRSQDQEFKTSLTNMILSTRCWGVSPSWFMRIMITVPTIL